MNHFTMLLAQAAETTDPEAGAVVIGWIILIGIVAAIYNACTKKKSYDVDFRGQIKER
ncbi:hypothetical protein GYB59_01365 [bacterium]|nr:hypothetical protein [bacterium]